ncbi:hypothetical protein [Alkalibacterium sp. MB6]|uniref:hypothetical protein n=1 Tax=Alkalibacterium sp. MB6 TaxID=2081965 RepID=UPI001379A147|nr:hypothetical protein [Alkalibacterium sp. MB6]
MAKREWNKRLKNLETLHLKGFDSPVFIDLLEGGHKDIYTFIKGKKKVLSEEDLKECNTLTFIDDI